MQTTCLRCGVEKKQLVEFRKKPWGQLKLQLGKFGMILTMVVATPVVPAHWPLVPLVEELWHLWLVKYLNPFISQVNTSAES